jgi:hypothetical protein
VKHLVLFSDTCGGQNRNQHFSSMCLRAVIDGKLDTLEHIYMESGHSQMEVDSVHSCIESACRNVDIHAPTGYYQLVATCRRKNPYQVIVMDTSQFGDYRELSASLIRNRRQSTSNIVNWLKIKWMKYDRSSPNTIFFRYDYESDFAEINVRAKSRGRKTSKIPHVKPLFREPPTISTAKYFDLMSLCDDGIILRDYQSFYKNLAHAKSQRDCLPEPDIDEHVNENSDE